MRIPIILTAALVLFAASNEEAQAWPGHQLVKRTMAKLRSKAQPHDRLAAPRWIELSRLPASVAFRLHWGTSVKTGWFDKTTIRAATIASGSSEVSLRVGEKIVSRVIAGKPVTITSPGFRPMKIRSLGELNGWLAAVASRDEALANQDRGIRHYRPPVYSQSPAGPELGRRGFEMGHDGEGNIRRAGSPW